MGRRNGNELENFFAFLETLIHFSLSRIHIVQNLINFSIFPGISSSIKHYAAHFGFKTFAFENFFMLNLLKVSKCLVLDICVIEI